MLKKTERIHASFFDLLGSNGDRLQSVLVCDDHPDIVTVLCRLLERNGYDVRVACDGIECLQAIEEAEPDILLLDLMMPRLDGFGVLEEIRERNFRKVVITAAILTPEMREKLEGLCDEWAIKNDLKGIAGLNFNTL